MDISEAELFLAYRQAKHALHQEQRGLGRIAHATAEQDLATTLVQLRQQLQRSPGWFDDVPIGNVWLVPKKGVPIASKGNVITVGDHEDEPLSRLDVRLHLNISIEFAIVEILWIWRFGAAIECSLTQAARGNRLRLSPTRSTVDRNARGPFRWWPRAYERFRSEAFDSARANLRRGKECLLATFDLAAYYDLVEPAFLIDQRFLAELTARSAAAAVSFDQTEYEAATHTLLRAFSTYREKCRQLTGLNSRRGIPIGCLTSRLIANVALAPLDAYVAAKQGVEYYARYVDDIILVATGRIRSLSASAEIARRFLPLTKAQRTTSRARRRDAMILDSTLLRRQGSRFQLQSAKLKGYFLKGRRGRDFLSTIERDVRLIASERRAFLHPDGLGTESPLRSLLVGSDAKAPVQVLRDVDRFKLERYAASVAVGKVAVGVELLDEADAAPWCKRQLGPVAAAATAAHHWVDYLDLGFRILGVSLRAGDTVTAKRVLARQLARWKSIRQGARPSNLDGTGDESVRRRPGVASSSG